MSNAYYLQYKLEDILKEGGEPCFVERKWIFVILYAFTSPIICLLLSLFLGVYALFFVFLLIPAYIYCFLISCRMSLKSFLAKELNNKQYYALTELKDSLCKHDTVLDYFSKSKDSKKVTNYDVYSIKNILKNIYENEQKLKMQNSKNKLLYSISNNNTFNQLNVDEYGIMIDTLEAEIKLKKSCGSFAISDKVCLLEKLKANKEFLFSVTKG